MEPGPVLPFPPEERAPAEGESRPIRRELARRRARVATYIRTRPVLREEPEAVAESLAAIGTVLRYDRVPDASTTFLVQRVKDRTGIVLTYGRCYRLLVLGELLGFWSWSRAWVPKHRGKLSREERADQGVTLYPSPEHYRPGQRARLTERHGKAPPAVLPCRRLHAAGVVATLMRGDDPERPGAARGIADRTSEPLLGCTSTPGSIQSRGDPPSEEGPPGDFGDAVRRALALLSKR